MVVFIKTRSEQVERIKKNIAASSDGGGLAA